MIQCLISAYNLSQALFCSIIAAPVDKFFDTHTLGTVINRFSRDQEAIDALVPDSLSQSLVNWPQLLSVLVLCIIASPYFVIFIVAICIGFYQVYIYYSSVSRDLKRLDAVSRSPVYATFAETLAGITTIRAFDDTQRFRDLMMAQMSTNQKFYFHTWMCQSWMTFRLGEKLQPLFSSELNLVTLWL
jgi:ATP-binding cassette subfamily C (CFTR/MRP) protein 1